MKKSALISFSSLIFLLMSSLVAYLLSDTALPSPYIYLALGAGLLASGAVLAYISGEILPLNILCFSLSAVALGFMIRAWYAFRGFENSMEIMILVSLAAAVYLFISFLVLKIPFIKRHRTPFLVIYVLLSLIAYIVVVFTTETTYVSTFGYYMIVELAFLYAELTEVSGLKELVRALTVCTFSVFGVGLVILLMLLLGDGDIDPGCDCLELCDCGSADDGTGKKKKRK